MFECKKNFAHSFCYFISIAWGPWHFYSPTILGTVEQSNLGYFYGNSWVQCTAFLFIPCFAQLLCWHFTGVQCTSVPSIAHASTNHRTFHTVRSSRQWSNIHYNYIYNYYQGSYRTYFTEYFSNRVDIDQWVLKINLMILCLLCFWVGLLDASKWGAGSLVLQWFLIIWRNCG